MPRIPRAVEGDVLVPIPGSPNNDLRFPIRPSSTDGLNVVTYEPFGIYLPRRQVNLDAVPFTRIVNGKQLCDQLEGSSALHLKNTFDFKRLQQAPDIGPTSALTILPKQAIYAASAISVTFSSSATSISSPPSSRAVPWPHETLEVRHPQAVLCTCLSFQHTKDCSQ